MILMPTLGLRFGALNLHCNGRSGLGVQSNRLRHGDLLLLVCGALALNIGAKLTHRERLSSVQASAPHIARLELLAIGTTELGVLVPVKRGAPARMASAIKLGAR
jgi:hypothetical protein